MLYCKDIASIFSNNGEQKPVSVEICRTGTEGTFPRVKRPGLEADNSPPTSAEVKKICIYTSTPPYAIME
jgi:hypothetical protein